MSVSPIDGHIDDDVQLMIDNAQALLKVTNLDLLREVVAEVRFKVRNGMPMLSNQRRKYILMIKAIDKQIPQKPFGKSPFNECPCCGKTVHKEMKHCNECGQALDWSDTDLSNGIKHEFDIQKGDGYYG